MKKENNNDNQKIIEKNLREYSMMKIDTLFKKFNTSYAGVKELKISVALILAPPRASNSYIQRDFTPASLASCVTVRVNAMRLSETGKVKLNTSFGDDTVGVVGSTTFGSFSTTLSLLHAENVRAVKRATAKREILFFFIGKRI